MCLKTAVTVADKARGFCMLPLHLSQVDSTTLYLKGKSGKSLKPWQEPQKVIQVNRQPSSTDTCMTSGPHQSQANIA